jgi:hypothetical protein
MPQLATAEMAVIDRIVRTEKKSGTIALKKVNDSRKKKGIDPIGHSAVFNFINGVTHQRGETDNRGPNQVVKNSHVRKLMITRRKLIKKANNDYRVTYDDVITVSPI